MASEEKKEVIQFKKKEKTMEGEEK